MKRDEGVELDERVEGDEQQAAERAGRSCGRTARRNVAQPLEPERASRLLERRIHHAQPGGDEQEDDRVVGEGDDRGRSPEPGERAC